MMRFADLKIYAKFLLQNKLYTFVSMFGFSVSLMFVIILGIYVQQERSYDNFQKNRDRIFLMTHDDEYNFGNTVAQLVKDQCPEVESYVRTHGRPVSVGKKGESIINATGLFADSTFFSVFTFDLIEGTPSQVLAARKSVVLTRDFANKAFAGTSPVGKTMVIDGLEHTVTGIMENIPQNTTLPDADFVVNYNSITNYWGNWVLETSGNFGFSIFLLTKEGADIQPKIPMILDLLKKDIWFYRDGFTNDLKLIPLKDVYLNVKRSGYGDLRLNSGTLINVYIGIVFLILIIALLNYVNLTVAQSGFRGKETAIKKLLGCERRDLIVQLLAESFVITFITFFIGLALAFLTEPFFDNSLNTKLELAQKITPSFIGFSLIFILSISIISGLIPALVISGFNPIEVVKGTLSRKVKSNYSKVLIIFQYTVSIILLTCCFFMQKQSDFLLTYDLGFNKEGILEMANNDLNQEQLNGFKAKLNSIPGVELVSYTCGTPLDGGNNMSYERDGEQFSFQELYVDSAFFKIYGITIDPTDVQPTENTYWVNRKAYNALRPDPATQEAIFGSVRGEEKFLIAGILSDFKVKTLHHETGLLRIRMLRENERAWNIIVKISAGADRYKTAELVENEYKNYSGGEMLGGAKFTDDIISDNYQKEQKAVAIMSAFAALTIIIMVMGVFAMSLYIVRQKRKEVAIRKVNGATVGEILLNLNTGSLIYVAIALAIASPIAYYAMNKWLENFAYKISLDWWVFLLAGCMVLLLTLLSISWMTWKAANQNPVDAIHNE
ncbi:putative ABC transport system permease protein [Dysgonomonas sp. PFB1-18]|uniref:ABC transporter permease n=1 Tax=unclassified Dysgonomonas TaxID=2630389 RepID=UPI00247484BC|nr:MULTISPECIES: FtsX-like permease family protein [unclassified Dysgonomonas]MDH6309515.1 putative ABC transport system permease protein [Dysgonomonas sp. PF1-14]MDH6339157.1 putative ABC transport system permease protein [Dysgonomonas sp. PF1-16]MDH6380557.1 putative ABC transport system permease protein [Dysgonomonas sp. PFB1-18]MDH6398053.1 putative ABC transport system permease protein [Dysgonomonas sp. PF1-23]